MDKNPGRVSIIIPVYNRPDLVRPTIESVLTQSYKDIEVILVDDGSSDDTGPVLQQYGDAIKIISQSHRGQSAARNTGIAGCSGEYVMFLDSDDCLETLAVESLLTALKEMEETQSDWIAHPQQSSSHVRYEIQEESFGVKRESRCLAAYSF